MLFAHCFFSVLALYSACNMVMFGSFFLPAVWSSFAAVSWGLLSIHGLLGICPDFLDFTVGVIGRFCFLVGGNILLSSTDISARCFLVFLSFPLPIHLQS